LPLSDSCHVNKSPMLSAIGIVKNESHHIERCLQSVLWADEIIILDSGSTEIDRG
jgi:Glycosyl transferase family 2.